VIFVENDPALLGIMSTSLSSYAQIELLGAFTSPGQALDRELIARADAALLDLDLGPTHLSGIELGIAMRNLNENIGLVIYSQYSMVDLSRRVPESIREGWSFIEKSPKMDLDEVVHILVQTARGMSHGFLLTDHDSSRQTASGLSLLTPRQRVIMGLMSSGTAAKNVAEQVGCSYEALRQELTICYRVLAPDATDTEDRRVKAILAYLELTGTGP